MIVHGILKVLFFSDTSFFSISEVENEISLLVSDDSIDHFPQDIVTQTEFWRPIKRFKKRHHSE